jgi:enoyl-CoA hydratase/carnithine racemase
MSDKRVTYATDNAVATITIDNPPMNPLTTKLREQFLAIQTSLGRQG